MKTNMWYLAGMFMLLLSCNSPDTGSSDTSAGKATEKKYKYIIKGGRLIDPKNNIDDHLDIAVSFPTTPDVGYDRGSRDGRIALVSKNIDPDLAVQVIDASGLIVTPGLVDIHAHLFWGLDTIGGYRNGPQSLPPDGYTSRSGVTTIVDAGSSGWKNFGIFKSQTIDVSQARVLAFLNIVGEGMAGGKYENDLKEMDPQKTAEFAKNNSDYIVGIKLAHFSGRDWRPAKMAEEAATLANIPLMVDFGGANPALSLDTLLNIIFKPGDIYTHCFGGNPQVPEVRPGGREAIVNVKGEVKPYAWTARKRGIIFDTGFGAASFLFSVGKPCIDAGFFPNSISTDMHNHSAVMNNAMKDMPNIMGLFVALGMDLQSVIRASTCDPAMIINREDLGQLSVGALADIAIFNIREGNFGFWARDSVISGTKRFETELTMRGGEILYNLNGRIKPFNVPR